MAALLLLALTRHKRQQGRWRCHRYGLSPLLLSLFFPLAVIPLSVWSSAPVCYSHPVPPLLQPGEGDQLSSAVALWLHDREQNESMSQQHQQSITGLPQSHDMPNWFNFHKHYLKANAHSEHLDSVCCKQELASSSLYGIVMAL